MMHTANGRADLSGSPIELGDFLPERREVVLNGQKYLAWVTTNKRFPRSVQAQLDTARNRYLRIVGPLLEPDAADADQEATAQAARVVALEQAALAYARYVTDALLALIPGLGETDADMIDQDSVSHLLTELGYFRSNPAPEVSDEDGPLSTGASLQPVSPDTSLATPTSDN